MITHGLVFSGQKSLLFIHFFLQLTTYTRYQIMQYPNPMHLALLYETVQIFYFIALVQYFNLFALFGLNQISSSIM